MPSRQPGSRHAADVVKKRRPSRGIGAKPGSASAAGGGRKGKFNAQGERVNGIWMASGAQAERYRQLLEMEQAGRISQLRTEVSFDLVVKGTQICRYRADFVYIILDSRLGQVGERIEDVKGMMTADFALKWKLFDAIYASEGRQLDVIHVKGKVIHPDPEHRGQDGKGNGAGWMHKHWAGKVPRWEGGEP